MSAETIPPEMAAPIAAIRNFGRFYTRQLGLLKEGLLKSDFTLTEGRIIYEVATRPDLTATELGEILAMDPGYLSRQMRIFRDRGLVSRCTAPEDARKSRIRLTEAGRQAFDRLDLGSRQQVLAMIRHLPSGHIARLTQAMETIESLLSGTQLSSGAVTLRPLALGDIGWITHRHGILYAQEYGWDQTFEILVAEILARLAKTFDPEREGSWVAEHDGAVIGSVFVERESDEVAKLRLLYVEPTARGLGLGRRLVDTCIGFARDKGYRKLTLWTNDVLVPARRIYQAAGFVRISGEPVHAFGKDMVSEIWDLVL